MKKKNKNELPLTAAFGKENYMLIGVGLIFIIVGFLMMIGGNSDDPNVFNKDEIYSDRRITYAPIMVFIGYIIEIYAIFKPAKQEAVEED
jgi:uncharacterized membrane protein